MAFGIQPLYQARSGYEKPTFRPTAKQLEHFKQLAGPERFFLAVGGSRSGKTTDFVHAIMVRAIRAAFSSHAILRFRGNAAQASISMDTLPKVNRLCFPQVPLIPRGRGNDAYFELPNQSRIWVGGLDDKERVEKILGQEHSSLLFNEVSQISYQSVLVALTRLAQNIEGLRQRAYFDLNPTGMMHWTNQLFLEHRDPISHRPLSNPEEYKYIYMNPMDNKANLTPAYIDSLMALPERQRKRFFDGKYTAEVDGALWTYDILERNRREEEDIPPMRRIVVGVDPSGASGESDTGSEIGIIAVGLGEDNHGYVLKDRSCRESPAVWGQRAVSLLREVNGDAIIGESNFGGEMVAFVIETADKRVKVKLVTASRGKTPRAEPISALYEKDLVHHIGRLPELEDQLCSMSTNGYVGEGSPDRADAGIWGLTELMMGMVAPVTLPRSEELSEEEEQEGLGLAAANVADTYDAPWNMGR